MTLKTVRTGCALQRFGEGPVAADCYTFTLLIDGRAKGDERGVGDICTMNKDEADQRTSGGRRGGEDDVRGEEAMRKYEEEEKMRVLHGYEGCLVTCAILS